MTGRFVVGTVVELVEASDCNYLDWGWILVILCEVVFPVYAICCWVFVELSYLSGFVAVTVVVVGMRVVEVAEFKYSFEDC